MIYDGSVQDTTNVCSNEYITINSCNIQRNARKPYTVIREHGRVDYHILYLAAGECVCLYHGAQIVMKKGDFVLYPPSVKQQYSFAEGCAATTLWVHFSGYGIKSMLQRLRLFGGVSHAASEKDVETCFENMIYHHSVCTDQGQIAAEGDLMRLLSLLSEEDGAQQAVLHSSAVEGMLAYIHANWQRTVAVADVAKKVCLSESRTAHLFRAAIGKGIHQYVMELRIATAKELLQSTDMSICEIGEMVGFQDALYFSRAFKAATQLSPRAFREAVRQKDGVES